MSLRAERRNRGLTLIEMAAEIGVAAETYRRAEIGLGLRPAHAKRIADFFDVKVTDIWPEPDAEPKAAHAA